MAERDQPGRAVALGRTASSCSTSAGYRGASGGSQSATSATRRLIRALAVRGAPAIGLAAAYALAAEAQHEPRPGHACGAPPRGSPRRGPPPTNLARAVARGHGGVEAAPEAGARRSRARRGPGAAPATPPRVCAIGALRRGAVPGRAGHAADPLQRRGAGHRRDRHGAGHRPRAPRRGAARAVCTPARRGRCCRARG